VLSLHNLRVRRRHARRVEWGVSSKVRPRPGGPVDTEVRAVQEGLTCCWNERATSGALTTASHAFSVNSRWLICAREQRERSHLESPRVGLHRGQDRTPRAWLPHSSSRTFFWLPSSDAARATCRTLRPGRPRGGGGQGGAGGRTARRAAARMATCLTPPPARNMASRTAADAGHARKALRAAGQQSGARVAYPTRVTRGPTQTAALVCCAHRCLWPCGRNTRAWLALLCCPWTPRLCSIARFSVLNTLSAPSWTAASVWSATWPAAPAHTATRSRVRSWPRGSRCLSRSCVAQPRDAGTASRASATRCVHSVHTRNAHA
jgi:hypothetical protein